MIGIFEIITILLFSSTLFICYNTLVAKTTGDLIKLKIKLKNQLVKQATELAKKVTITLREDLQKLAKEETLINKQTLQELLVEKADDNDYKLFIDKLSWIVKDLYENYQFLRQDPQKDDFMSGYFLGLQIIRNEYPVEYEYLFRLAIDRGLNDIKINQLILEALKNGEVLPLGDNIVIDESLSGCSSILQAQDIRVNIVFAPKEYMDKKEELIKERTESMEKQRKEQQELAMQKDNVVKSARLAEAVINELVDEVAEKHELQELVKQIKESIGYF